MHQKGALQENLRGQRGPGRRRQRQPAATAAARLATDQAAAQLLVRVAAGTAVRRRRSAAACRPGTQGCPSRGLKVPHLLPYCLGVLGGLRPRAAAGARRLAYRLGPNQLLGPINDVEQASKWSWEVPASYSLHHRPVLSAWRQGRTGRRSGIGAHGSLSGRKFTPPNRVMHPPRYQQERQPGAGTVQRERSSGASGAAGWAEEPPAQHSASVCTRVTAAQ